MAQPAMLIFAVLTLMPDYNSNKNPRKRGSKKMKNETENAKYDGVKLTDLGYGDAGEIVELTEQDVIELAACVAGSVEEIESCRIE
jgi:hypothetical protein